MQPIKTRVLRGGLEGRFSSRGLSMLVYWPRSHSVLVRMHGWKLDMTDEQFISYYNRRGEMRDGSLPFARMVDAVTDFNELARSDSADQLVTPSVTPLLGSVPLSDDPSLQSIRDQHPTSNSRVTRSSFIIRCHLL